MNGHTQMPAVTFGPDCTYDTLDTLLNDNVSHAWNHHGQRFGWACKIWFKQGVVITALWGSTNYNVDTDQDCTTLLAWSERDNDYCNRIKVVTDDIVKVEVL